jgi:4'-phosphopantetheinyl transferase
MYRASDDEGVWRGRAVEEAEPLGEGSVHVWRVGLEVPRADVARLAETLSEEERARAARFRSPEDGLRFTVAHGALRAILARYAGESAGGLVFHRNEYGKPALRGATEVRFNLAHSHAVALVAVARGREVGVDLERVLPGVEPLEIAGSYFTRREVAALAALPPEHRVHAFYRCWTRKEAFVKALGMGLSRALDSFDVSLDADSHAGLLRRGEDPEEAARWRLRALAPAPGYVGAVAVEGAGWSLRLVDLRTRARTCGGSGARGARDAV